MKRARVDPVERLWESEQGGGEVVVARHDQSGDRDARRAVPCDRVVDRGHGNERVRGAVPLEVRCLRHAGIELDAVLVDGGDHLRALDQRQRSGYLHRTLPGANGEDVVGAGVLKLCRHLLAQRVELLTDRDAGRVLTLEAHRGREGEPERRMWTETEVTSHALEVHRGTAGGAAYDVQFGCVVVV